MADENKYRSWQKDALAALARSRSIRPVSTAKNPAQGPTRIDYLHALQEDDRWWARGTFTFLDLSPELRNLVYNELLIIKQTERNCFPSILRTCRQIHDEATNILYGETEIPITLKPRSILVRGRACGDYFGGNGITGYRKDLLKLAWPTFLRHCQVLRFIVELDRSTGWLVYRSDDDHILINHILYSLCGHLQGSTHLRSMTIVLDRHTNSLNDVTKRQVFNPLQLLGPPLESIRLEYNGNIVQEVNNGNPWPVASPLTSTLPQVRAIIDEAIAYANLEAATYDRDIRKHPFFSSGPRTYLGYKGTGAATKARFDDLLLGEHDNQLEQLRKSMTPLVATHFCDAAWEDRLEQTTNLFRELLDRLRMDEIDAWAQTADRSGKLKVTKFKKLRELRKERERSAGQSL